MKKIFASGSPSPKTVFVRVSHSRHCVQPRTSLSSSAIEAPALLVGRQQRRVERLDRRRREQPAARAPSRSARDSSPNRRAGGAGCGVARRPLHRRALPSASQLRRRTSRRSAIPPCGQAAFCAAHAARTRSGRTPARSAATASPGSSSRSSIPGAYCTRESAAATDALSHDAITRTDVPRSRAQSRAKKFSRATELALDARVIHMTIARPKATPARNGGCPAIVAASTP